MCESSNISARLLRRLGSPRGSVFLEFGVIASFLVSAFAFGVDFVRTLYVEQQLEIANRVLADVESHMRPFYRDAAGREGSGCPASHGKLVCRHYLADALAREGFEGIGRDEAMNAVYCRAEVYSQGGPVHVAINSIVGFMKKLEMSDTPIVAILGKVFHGAVNLFTFRTFRYIEEIVPSDRGVKASVSVKVRPLVDPKIGWFGGKTKNGYMMIGPYVPKKEGGVAVYNRKLSETERERSACHMPVMDTVPMAPTTYCRMMMRLFGKWIK